MSTSSLMDEMEQHRSRVTRYIRYLVRNAAEAEDLAQETFMRAHCQRSTLRDPGALESWLYQIPLTTIKMRLHRARGQLQTALIVHARLDATSAGCSSASQSLIPHDGRFRVSQRGE